MNEAALGRLISVLGSLGGALLIALALVFFSPLAAAALAALWILAVVRPALAAPVLFVLVSIDSVRPVCGIFISLSELELSAVLMGCAVGWRSSWRRLDWRPVIWGAPYTAVLLVSGLVHSDWTRVLPHLLRLSELAVAVWLAGNAVAGTSRKAPVAAAALAAAFFSIAGLVQFPSAPGGRVWSFFGNPNQFGAYLNLLLPLVFAMLLSGRRGRWLWSGLFWLLVVSALAAQSRAGLMAGVAAVAAIGFLGFRELTALVPRPNLARLALRGGPVIVTGLVLAAVLGGALAFLGPSIRTGLKYWLGELESRSSKGVVADIMEERSPYYEVGFALWSEHPWLGVGPGNYAREVQRHWALVESYRRRLSNYGSFEETVTLHAHDLYLQLATETGLTGLTAFLFFLGWIWIELWRGPPTGGWRWAGIGIMVAFLVHNLFDVTFPSLAIETGLVLGMTLELKRPTDRGVVGTAGPC